jgi:gliding motility-associated-like protein
MNNLNNNNLNNLGSMFEQYEAPYGADEMNADWQQVADKIGVGGSATSAAGSAAKGSGLLNSIGSKIGLAIITVGAAFGVYSILIESEQEINEIAINEPAIENLNPESVELYDENNSSNDNEENGLVSLINKEEEKAEEKGSNLDPNENSTELTFIEEGNVQVDGKENDHSEKKPNIDPVELETEVVLSSKAVCQKEGLTLSIRNGKPGRLYWFRMTHKVNGKVETGAFEERKTVKPQIAGAYALSIFEMTGGNQKLIYEADVNVKTKPIAKFDSENTDCGELTLTSRCKNATECYWTVENKSLSGKQVELRFEKAGYKKVTLIADADGCADTLEKDVYAQQDIASVELEIPNFLTPNNDGKNDVWEITTLNEGIESYSGQYEIRSNQTGNLVFESNSLANKWNCKYMNVGAECESGMYTYIIKVNNPCSSGKQVIKTGLISIKR